MTTLRHERKIEAYVFLTIISLVANIFSRMRDLILMSLMSPIRVRERVVPAEVIESIAASRPNDDAEDATFSREMPVHELLNAS